MIVAMIGYGQLQKNNTTPIETEKKVEKYIIGIGNDEPSIYKSILEYLQNSSYVKVGRYCYLHQIIEVKVLNEEFKNYDEFLVYLKFEFDSLMIYRKDDSIFTKDCQDEILKQK